MKKRISKILIVVMLITLIPNIGAPTFAAGKVKLNKTKMSLYIGDTKTLKLQGTKKQVKWSSSKKAVATVSKKGKVLAIRKGTTTIKAKLGKKTYKCKVTVKNKKNSISYDKKLIKDKLKNEKDYEVTNYSSNQLTVQLPSDKNTESIKAGNVIMLPANEECEGGIALKVTDVQKNNDEIIIKGETPKIEEVFDKIDIAKTVSTNFDDIEVNKNYVQSVRTVNNGNSKKLRLLKAHDFEKTIGEDKKIDLPSIGNLSGSITIQAPTISAVIDANFSKGIIKKLNVDVETKATANVKVTSKTDIEPIPIAVLPNNSLGNGFMVDVLIFLNIDANGEVSVTYSVTNNTGFTYNKGDSFKPYNTTKNDWDVNEGTVDAKCLINPKVNIRLGGIWSKKMMEPIPLTYVGIVGAEMNIGPCLHSAIEMHETKPNMCINLDIYAYIDLKINKEYGLVGLGIDIFDINTEWILLDNNENNKLRKTYHFEDGTKVPKCTYEETKEESIKDFSIFTGTYGFQTGAGAWDTHFTINDDGSFSGNFHDLNMGDTGKGYPNGTMYICDFHGKFENLKKISQYKYICEVKDVYYDEPVGIETIENGMRYITYESYGVDSFTTYYFYLKGIPKSSLPKGFITSISIYTDAFKDGKLIRNGIYNSKSNAGFF